MTDPHIVPASTPVTADDVRAAVAKARQEAVVKASAAGAWAQPFADLLVDGLSGILDLSVSVGMPGSVHLHRMLSSWRGDRTRQVEVAYESPGHVLIVVGDSGDDDDPVLFEDVVSEREALGMIANWAIQPI